MLHVIYQHKLEKNLYKLKLTLTLLFLRDKSITLLKGDNSLQAYLGQILGMYEPVFS